MTTDRNDRLVEMNDALAGAIMKRIRSSEATAQDFNVARQFLKDNNVQAILEAYETPDQQDNPVFQLAQQYHEELNAAQGNAAG